VEIPLLQLAQVTFETSFSGVQAAQRHESVLYWFDSDWFSVLIILIGLLAYDLIDRRFADSLWLPGFMIAGALLGYFAQAALVRFDWTDAIWEAFVRPQGDP